MLVLHPALQNDRALYSAIWHFGTARDQPRASFELTARVDGSCSILFSDFLRPSLYVKKGAIILLTVAMPYILVTNPAKKNPSGKWGGYTL